MNTIEKGFKYRIDVKPSQVELINKTIGCCRFVWNYFLEIQKTKFENKEKWEFVPKYAVGMSYGVTDLLRVGIEAKGSKDGHYVGPVISHGVEHLWVALGSAINVNEVKTGKPELQFRMILGIVL